MKEELINLAQFLQNESENLVSQQISDWLTNDFLTDEYWLHLGEIEHELADFCEINEEFAALEAWLTSVFIPGQLPDFHCDAKPQTADNSYKNLHSFPVSSVECSHSLEKSTPNLICWVLSFLTR